MTTKILGYIWEVIKNIIVLFVILGILSVAYTSFEKVVICSLILIYLSIVSFSGVWGFQQLSFLEALDFEFKRLRRLLKEEPDEYEKKQTEEFKAKKQNISVKFYINTGFNILFYIIVILNLLGNI